MTSQQRTLVAAEESARLLRRGRALVYATTAWNVLEIVVLGWAAVAAQSVALAAFALDSCIEIFASMVVLWELGGVRDRERERRALRLIGVAFLGLAVFIGGQSIATVIAGVRPEESPVGIGWLALTCAAMFGLGVLKRRTGDQLDNNVLRAEAGVTFIDGALAAAILAGLIMNAVAGWWWADIGGGVIIVVYGVKEGIASLRASSRPAD